MSNFNADDAQPEATEESVLLEKVGDVADLTLGKGGNGSESKRYEYN